MTPTNKNYIGVGLMGLAIIAFWVFGLPSWNEISVLKTAIRDQESILSERESVLTKINELNQKYKERLSDINKISSVVPNVKSIAELVSTVETTTQQTGLQLIEITTGGAIQADKETQTISMELGLIGSYPSLTSFLSLLEKNIRLIDVFEISISQQSAPGAEQALNFRVKANAYYLSIK